MALDPQALVTTEEARTYLDVGKTDKPEDGLLELVINGISKRLAQRTGRTYVNPVAKDGASESSYEFDPADRRVDVADCRDVTAVAITATPGDADSWLDLDPATYVLEPVGQPVGTAIRFFTGIELPAQGIGWGGLSMHRHNGPEADTMRTEWPWEGERSIDTRAVARVTAKLGLGPDADTAPANVKLAVLMWLQNIHKRDQAFFSETIGVASALTRMPPDVVELLEGEPDDVANVGAV